MAFDAYNLSALVNEIAMLLTNGKINKITMPEKDEIVLTVYNIKPYKLLISANPSVTRMHITKNDKKNPETAYAFCMLLRKHLINSSIISIEQAPFDRIVTMTFLVKDELGFTSKRKLAIELTGKTSNIILCDGDDKIIDMLKHFSIDDTNTRALLLGATYHQPQLPENRIRYEQIDENITGDKTQYLADKLVGASYNTAQEIMFTYNGSMKKSIELFIQRLSIPNANIIYDNDTPKDVFAIDYITLKNNKQFFDSINDAFDCFYSQKDNLQRYGEKTKQASTIVKNAISRTEKKLAIQSQCLLDASNNETNRICGELILGNLHNISPRMTQIDAINYYDDSNPTITIKLDTQLTGQQNAQKYFKLYAKQKSSILFNTKLIAENTQMLSYLNSILLSIKNCNNEEELNEIIEELSSLKLIKKQSTKNKNKTTKQIHLTEYSVEGYTVYVGKNNIQNEYLTNKLAKNNDLWLHTKNIHSSHVVIKDQNTTIPDKVIEIAAQITAYYSQAKNSSKIEVDYTTINNVKKPSGAPLGFVNYVKYKTCIVDSNPNAKLLK